MLRCGEVFHRLNDLSVDAALSIDKAIDKGGSSGNANLSNADGSQNMLYEMSLMCFGLQQLELHLRNDLPNLRKKLTLAGLLPAHIHVADLEESA